MPEEESRPEGPGWLLEPPAAGKVHLNIAVGSEVELSPEARAALEVLLSALQDDEVVGFFPPCGGLAACGGYLCKPLGKCEWLGSIPCLMRIYCQIAEFQ